MIESSRVNMSYLKSAFFRKYFLTKSLSLITGLLLLFGLTGCSGPEVYGPGVNKELPVVQIRDILFNPELQGTPLTIQGNIVSLCPSRGCWFYLQDNTGRILVDLSKTDITLPYRQGRIIGSSAIVSGLAAMSQGSPIMEATGLEVR